VSEPRRAAYKWASDEYIESSLLPLFSFDLLNREASVNHPIFLTERTRLLSFLFPFDPFRWLVGYSGRESSRALYGCVLGALRAWTWTRLAEVIFP
jgi:hypothetical protein